MPSVYYTLIFTMIVLLVHLELKSRCVEEKLKGDIVNHCTMYFIYCCVYTHLLFHMSRLRVKFKYLIL